MRRRKRMEEHTTKQQLARVMKMAWPAVLESFFISLAGMIDVLMVSDIGSEAVAAVGLTTQPKFLGLCAFFAMNVSVAAIIARRKGEQDPRAANETLAEALLVVMGLGIVITVICVAGADTIIRLCGSRADTHDDAVLYFRIIMGGMLFNIISMCINAAQRGAGNTKIAMYTNVISSVVNIAGNYVLINGRLGFPRLGITGAALATVLGTVVACVICIISLFHKDSFLSLPYIWKEKLGTRFRTIKTIFRLSSSAFMEQLLMRIGFMSTAVMAADMGTAAMAAHQVGMNALSLSFSLGDGMQAAAVALIGQSLGKKEPEMANRYGNLCQRVGMVMGILISCFYFFCGRGLFELFFEEGHIVDMGVGISRCIMIIVLFQVPQVVFTGCLRGAGDVFFTMISSCISVTFVRTIASYVCCYTLGFGIYGIWMGILADQVCRMCLGMWRYRSRKWMKIVL